MAKICLWIFAILSIQATVMAQQPQQQQAIPPLPGTQDAGGDGSGTGTGAGAGSANFDGNYANTVGGISTLLEYS